MSKHVPHSCVHCGSDLNKGALVCAECERYQVPRWMARFSAHPISRFIKLLAIGVVIGLGGMIYQVQSERHQVRSERSKDLVAASISIQTLAEKLQHPCPLDKENEEECGNIYEERVGEFGRLAYVFKDSARSLLDRYPADSRIMQAIGFIDDFYNPGILDTSRLMVFPLQVELLRSRDLLTTTREDARNEWCTVESRAQLRALAASIDTYRYCYKAVRSFVADHAYQNWLSARFSPIDPWPEIEDPPSRLDVCSEGDLETRANRIYEILNSEQGPNYSAAWHYDQLCEESPRESIQWGLIPPASEQLLVVLTDDWNATTGTLQRKQRSLGGAWENVGEPVTVNVGRNGLAWGRGLHPFPGLTVADYVCEDCVKPPPPKREGDGRAPAGLFRLGSTHYNPQEHSLGQDDLLRLGAQAIPNGLFCEDRPGNPDYNRLIELSAEEQSECSTVGRCPEPVNREDGLYDTLIWVEHNAAGSPGAGSCIFLHFQQGDGVPTAGCTSARREDLAEIIGWLNPAKVPLLLQLPRAEYEARKMGWVLPPP